MDIYKHHVLFFSITELKHTVNIERFTKMYVIKCLLFNNPNRFIQE